MLLILRVHVLHYSLGANFTCPENSGQKSQSHLLVSTKRWYSDRSDDNPYCLL